MTKVTDQVNVRVPLRSRELVGRVARRLREDAEFFHRLLRFMTEEEASGTGRQITARLDRLEAEVLRLSTLLGVAERDEADATAPSSADASGAAESSPWVAGEGKGRRLTPEGEAELQRLLDAGFNDAEIARRLSVRAFSVASKRRRRDRDAEAAGLDEAEDDASE